MNNFIKNNKLKEKRKARHLNIIKLKNDRIKECLEYIDENTIEGQIYNKLDELDKQKLYLINNPNCYKIKKNKTLFDIINNKKDKILTSNISREYDNNKRIMNQETLQNKKYKKNIDYKNISSNNINITNHWNVINSPKKTSIHKQRLDVNKQQQNINSYINIKTSKITYKEAVLKNIKYNILNKKLDKEIRQTVLINKIKNYYKNKTYSNIDSYNIKPCTVDNTNNYCTIC